MNMHLGDLASWVDNGRLRPRRPISKLKLRLSTDERGELVSFERTMTD